MNKLSIFPRQQVKHEDCFLARYERLLAFARQLRDVDAQRAEDLVHDAFVQFIVSRPPLENIDNLDGYLQRMVRNLQLSDIRRRTPVQSLPPEAVEHETAALQWQALKDRASRAAANAELTETCRYAIRRKESSRTGSVLILRFFHGYYIHEIAQLLRTQKQPVYDLLRIARREARVFRENGEQLHFIANAPDTATVSLPPESSDEDELVESLRDAIFNSCRTACLPVKQLRQLYRAEPPENLITEQAAHLVSCRRCLEVVNRELSLRSLQDRFPTDTLGPGTSSGDTKRPAASPRKRPPRDWLSECRARADEIYHHEPEELLVSVNGFVIVRQTISGGASEQTTSINLSEPIGFVEIFCEHGQRLAFSNVEPPTEGPGEQQWQHWQIHFSGGRVLDLSLNFERAWPQLHVCYQATVESGWRVADHRSEESSAAPHPLFDLSLEPQGPLAKLKSAIRNPPSAIRWLLRPVTTTLLLTLVLLTIVVGQKLGWWLAPTPLNRVPVNTLPPRALPAERALPNAVPEVSPTVETPTGKATVAPVPSPAVVSATATAALEIEVLRLLNAARADLNEQIEVRRTPQNRLRIDAILDTEARKAELLQALASVREHPAVELHLQTVAEALTRQSRSKKSAPSGSILSSAGGVIEREEISTTTLPVDAELRRYLGGRNLAGAALDAELRRLAATVRAQSFKARSHATALKQLAARFTAEQLRELEATARAQWLGLLRNHAQQTRAAALTLRQQLAPVFTASVNDGAETMTIRNDEELRRASERLAQLCAESDRIVQAAFTISSDAAPAAAIRTPGFWQRLHRIEHLAEAISTVQ